MPEKLAYVYTSFLGRCSADPSVLLSILHRKLTPKMAAALMRFIRISNFFLNTCGPIIINVYDNVLIPSTGGCWALSQRRMSFATLQSLKTKTLILLDFTELPIILLLYSQIIIIIIGASRSEPHTTEFYAFLGILLLLYLYVSVRPLTKCACVKCFT